MTDIYKMSVEDIMYVLGERIAEDFNETDDDEGNIREEMEWFCNVQVTDSVHQSALGKFNKLQQN